MKYCPTCETQYTDNSLRFCLQDGSQLDEVREAETPTVVLDETPTVTRHRVPSRSYETTPDASRRVSGESFEKKRSMVIPAIVALLGAAALFIAGAAATWMYVSKPKIENGNNTPGVNPPPSPANVSGNRTPRVTPTPTGDSSPASSASRTPFPVDRSQAERDISDMIDRWSAQAEDLDLESYMENYAPRVDYYNRKGADKTYVREDKGRAFRMYRSIGIETPNMRVSVDESGDSATAEFDKIWDFRGNRNSLGKVRTELRLRRESGRWLITGERDVKVYYVN